MSAAEGGAEWSAGRGGWWSRVLALVSVLAVLAGLHAAPPELARHPAVSVSPAPLPELRAATPTPPLTPTLAAGVESAPVLPRPAVDRREGRLLPQGSSAVRFTLAQLGRRQSDGG